MFYVDDTPEIVEIVSRVDLNAFTFSLHLSPQAIRRIDWKSLEERLFTRGPDNQKQASSKQVSHRETPTLGRGAIAG